MTDSPCIYVPEELFAPAESSAFHGEYELPLLVAGPDDYRFAGPIAWDAVVTNTGDALLVTGEARGRATTACARCLEDFEVELRGEIEGYFLLSGEGQAPEDMDDDEFDVLPESHVISMAPLVQAALLLELPLVPLCDEECKGLCPTCGANLNERACGCATQPQETLSVNPFAALKDFSFDDERNGEHDDEGNNGR